MTVVGNPYPLWRNYTVSLILNFNLWKYDWLMTRLCLTMFCHEITYKTLHTASSEFEKWARAIVFKKFCFLYCCTTTFSTQEWFLWVVKEKPCNCNVNPLFPFSQHCQYWWRSIFILIFLNSLSETRNQHLPSHYSIGFDDDKFKVTTELVFMWGHPSWLWVVILL